MISAEDALARRRRFVRVLAWATAALMLATIALSAYMRLWQSGLGCDPWPACFAQTPAQTQSPAATTAPAADGSLALARLLHRMAASVVLVLALMLVLATLGMRPRLPRAGRLALVLLLLTLALATLGVVMRASTLPAVVLGNLMGGFLMLALATRLAAPAAAGVRGARLGLALLLLQIAFGALISATRATLDCAGLAACLQAAPTPGSWLQLLHRALALLLLAVLAAVAWALRRQGARVEAAALAGLLLLQLLVGGLLAPAGWPLAQVLAHNLTAALLLALLLRRA